MVQTDGNLLSTLVFFLWVPIALWGARQWPPAKTAALLLLLPLMFLPEVVYFDLPGLPPFEKGRTAIVWLLIGVLLFHRQRLSTVELSKWTKFSMVLLLVGGVVTVLLNLDPVSDAAIYLHPHQPYDVVNIIITGTLDWILPFVLGAAMFNSSKDLQVLFRLLVAAVLAYSLLLLVEIRLSPQMNNWVYGFFQGNFAQTVRQGGYRPTVFMTNGIAVAMLTMVGVVAAGVLHKARIKTFGIGSVWVLAYLWVVLVLSKSVAALLYTLVAVPLILFSTPKTHFRVAVFLAVTVLLYPALRATGFVPTEDITAAMAEEFGEERAESLTTRFTNEEVLLERASERSFFGWGTYGRASIYSAYTGRETSIPDGDWIITLGTFGLVGFLAKYLLLLLPIFAAARQAKYLRRQSDLRLLSALTLVVAFSAFDLLPNGNFNYLLFVLSGALVGCSTGMRRHAAEQARLKRTSLAPVAGPGPGP